MLEPENVLAPTVSRFAPIPSHSQAQAALYAKWSKVQKAVALVAKNGKNDFHGFNYIRAEDLSAAVNAALSEHGLSMLYSITSVEAPREVAVKGGPVIRVFADITIVDGETGASFTCKTAGDGQDGADKALPKAVTASLKYWLKTSLLVSDSEHEADAGEGGESQRETRPRRKAPVGFSNDEKAQRTNLIDEIGRAILGAQLAGGDRTKLAAASEWLQKTGPIASLTQLAEMLKKVESLPAKA